MIQAKHNNAIVKSQRLSHGTLVCRDLAKSRRFYEEFLGLEVIHFIKPAMMLRHSSNCYIACINLGEKVPENTVWSHFGINVGSREEVDQAYADALRLQEEYELLTIEKPQTLHGAYQFYLQDRDTNWWEIQYEPRSIDDFFSSADLDTVSH
ncbi:MAG: VOC family protein [Snowella sp.]|nr:VOC family protein [Snowella sp.]